MLSINNKGRRYHEIQSLRDISRTNFPNGQIRFNFSVPAGESWNPFLSHFLVRYELSRFTSADNDNERIAPGTGVAPSMYFMDSIWQQLEIRIGGVIVNKWNNYCHQLAALRHRMQNEDKHRTWYQHNYHQPSVADRSIDIGTRSAGFPYNRPGWTALSDVLGGRGPNTVPLTYARRVTSAADTITVPGMQGTGIDDILQVDSPVMLVYYTANRVLWTRIEKIRSTAVPVVNPDAGIAIILVDNLPINIVAGDLGYSMEVFLFGDTRNDFEPGFRRREILWRPALGFWQQDVWLPGGEYEICLTPYPDIQYKNNAIELEKTIWPLDIDVTTNFEIINMVLNICTCNQPATTQTIEFTELRCQAKTINTVSLSQKQFIINPKTHCLTIAYQDNRVQNKAHFCPAKFKIYEYESIGDAGGIARFPLGNDDVQQNWELNLGRFFIQWDGEVLPNPLPDMRHDFDNKYWMQRYWETQKYKMLIYDDIETYQEWIERGPYFHFTWPRKNMNAKEVQVSQQWNQPNLPDGVTPQLLLFEHYKCAYKLECQNGFITRVVKTF